MIVRAKKPNTGRPGVKVDAWSIVEGLIDARTWPTILVDCAARVLAANPAAISLLEADGDWQVGRNDDLRNSTPATTAEIQACIRSLIENPEPDVKRIARFAVQDDGQQTLIMMTRVEPRPDAHGGSRTCTAHAVLLTIYESNQRETEQSTKTLYDLFALTPAEARVAFALLDGMSLQAFSNSAGVRLSTVRWHLRNALAKTNCANQRDLVRLLMALVDH